MQYLISASGDHACLWRPYKRRGADCWRHDVSTCEVKKIIFATFRKCFIAHIYSTSYLQHTFKMLNVFRNIFIWHPKLRLTGEYECDDSKDEAAAEGDDAREDDVSSVRLDMSNQQWLMTLLSSYHHDALLLLLRRRWRYLRVSWWRIAGTHRMPVRRGTVRHVPSSLIRVWSGGSWRRRVGAGSIFRFICRRRRRSCTVCIVSMEQGWLSVWNAGCVPVLRVAWRSWVRVPGVIHVDGFTTGLKISTGIIYLPFASIQFR